MAKKSFLKEAQTGIDSLITPTTQELEQKPEKNTKTSLILPEDLYIEFRVKYLVPNKISLKEFIVNEMEKTLSSIK